MSIYDRQLLPEIPHLDGRLMLLSTGEPEYSYEESRPLFQKSRLQLGLKPSYVVFIRVDFTLSGSMTDPQASTKQSRNTIMMEFVIHVIMIKTVYPLVR